MTFREKLQKEHPEKVHPTYGGGCYGCPSDYGYEPDCSDCRACRQHCRAPEKACKKCWDRKIPEADLTKNQVIKRVFIALELGILALLLLALVMYTVSAAEAEPEVDIVAMSEEIHSCSLGAEVDRLLGRTAADIIAEIESRPDPKDIEMLALVIYQEVGGDAHCDECRRRVADVVLNRVEDDRFPDDIYSVLVQPGQYGRLSWTGLVWASRASSPWEANAVARAYRIAEEVLMGQHSDLYGKGYVWQAGFVQGKDNIWCCGHYFGR